ncbi:hypothetical protein L2E82_16357 [Cichorium intybus]|uniref:Uncharacterized protein n=1 Tax=Cichorium intybus TaxID=13427 RepID=A0ACB9F504_CICIN|nr:hypothetical protein L2E82_16357 [Cichorium intybus]
MKAGDGVAIDREIVVQSGFIQVPIKNRQIPGEKIEIDSERDGVGGRFMRRGKTEKEYLIFVSLLWGRKMEQGTTQIEGLTVRDCWLLRGLVATMVSYLPIDGK